MSQEMGRGTGKQITKVMEREVSDQMRNVNNLSLGTMEH